MSAVTYREACRQALREALQADPRAFLMGEDVGKYGGCYAVTKGLLEEFGPERIVDTPLAENGFVGMGIGAALAGLRPIVEIMTGNFSLLALDQIVNNAATIPHMSGGQFAIPLVIRMATGAGRQLAAQHSHSFEGWYAHIPGLKVAAPGTVEDARFMLAAALADPNPVLLFEHIGLYAMEEELDGGIDRVDLMRARVQRPGRDVTIASYGAGLQKSLEAARRLAQEGVEAEVIDLRILRPLDDETVASSVARTHRCVIVDEGWRSGSVSAELAARLAEEPLRARRADPPRLRPGGAGALCGPPGGSVVAPGAAGDGRRARPACEGLSMQEFRMPALGADMEKGRLVQWCVPAGAHVKPGDIVAVVETQKGAIDVEIFLDGVLEDLVPLGSELPVGAVLAHVRGQGETSPAPEAAPAPVPPAAHVRASPAARRRAQGSGSIWRHWLAAGPMA